MKKIIFGAVLAVFLSLFGGQAFAQCYQAPSILGQGPQGGNPCWGGNQQQVIVSRPVVTQTFIPNQAPNQAPNQVPSQPVGSSGTPCSWGGRVENITAGVVVGAILGVLAGDNSRAARQGGAVGGLVGASLPCSSQPQQVATTQQQAVVSQGQTNNCAANLSWKKLDWSGHPQHGNFLCLPAEEVIAQQKSASQPKNDHGCTSGTSWKKLNWEDHPQNGNFLCLPADEVIEQQKAALIKK